MWVWVVSESVLAACAVCGEFLRSLLPAEYKGGKLDFVCVVVKAMKNDAAVNKCWHVAVKFLNVFFFFEDYKFNSIEITFTKKSVQNKT